MTIREQTSHCECRCDAFLKYGPVPVLIRDLRELHEKVIRDDGEPVCAHCLNGDLSFMVWPCPTMRHVMRYEGNST
jgi:hypothetical protein